MKGWVMIRCQQNNFDMGCGSPQHTSVPANIPTQHLNRLMQVSQINHPLNVNKKYEHLSKLRDGTTGTGFKKTLTYDALTTREELLSKRKEFWETRVNGSPQCWQAIRSAVEQPQQATGSQLLQSMKISMLNGTVQMCVDGRFNKYEVPVFCINDPLTYAEEIIAEKNLNLEYEDGPVQFKVRSVRYPTEDILLDLQYSTTIAEAKKELRKKKPDLGEELTIRFFYSGREMLDSRVVGNYNYMANMVVQCLIKQ